MRYRFRALGLAALGASLCVAVIGGQPARAHATSSAARGTLRVDSTFKDKAGFQHTSGSVTAEYANGHATVRIVVTHLPPPSTVKLAAYIVWVTDGSTTIRAGRLNMRGFVGSLRATVSLTTVSSVKITAEHSASSKTGNGPVVLSGTVS